MKQDIIHEQRQEIENTEIYINRGRSTTGWAGDDGLLTCTAVSLPLVSFSWDLTKREAGGDVEGTHYLSQAVSGRWGGDDREGGLPGVRFPHLRCHLHGTNMKRVGRRRRGRYDVSQYLS